MNDFKIMLNKLQQQYLERQLPKGYSFELYKVRKNIINYPYQEIDKKYKKNQPSIILTKKQLSAVDMFEQSQKSYKQRSEPQLPKEQLKKIQQDLLNLTRKLRKHESSYPFRNPVDPKALQIPDYLDIILQPIDLKTIEDKIRRDQYEHVSEFQRDIYKMIMNSYKYNQKLSTTEKKTIQFQQYYVQMMKEFHSSTKNGQQNNINVDENQKQIKNDGEMVDQRLEFQQSEIVSKVQEVKIEEVPKQTCSSLVNLFSAALKTLKKQPKQNSKLHKISMQIQRPRISKKQLPKSSSATHMPKPKQPKKVQTKIKKEQPEDDCSQKSLIQSIPINQLIFSQQIQPMEQKDLEQEQIKDEMKSYLDNQTQNNREQNFSQGYNQAALGGRIKNIQVQKQITNLLKRLSEFPLTKHKKIKNLSKFTNLEQNMTQTDKKKLYDRITKLDQNDVQYVVRILTKGKCETSKMDQFEIDLDKADSKILRQVQNFIALRDQSFAPINQPEVNGSMPLSFQPTPIVPQVPKIPKKAKKQEKKLVKKKTIRKNSNDDSFSLNPPPIKKKKSQKPFLKNLKNEQKSELNGEDQLSVNDVKQESSSYHPQPIHQHHHGKVIGAHMHHQKSQQIDKSNNSSEKPVSQNRKQKKSVSEQKQKTPRPQQYYQNHINNHHHSPNPYHHEDKFDDIGQFLAISHNFDNQPHEDMPFSYNRMRQPSNSIEQLDFMDLNSFGIGSQIPKNFLGEQMRDFSIYQPQKQQNDEDQFF